MEIFYYAIAFVFGAIIGSFLNVVIYRLHTGKSINTRSHCLSCGSSLRWFELFPVFSYLALKRKCRHCSAVIPIRYTLVEGTTGLMFLLLWHLYASDWVLLMLSALLVGVLIVISVYDIRHTIIPDELVICVGAIALLFLGYDLYRGESIEFIFLSIVGGVTAGLFMGSLWYFSNGRWIGLGDAKLAVPLGAIVGITGVFTMVVFSFWVGAFIGLMILLFQFLLNIWKRFYRYRVARSIPGDEELNMHQRLYCSSDGVEKYRKYFTIKSEIPFAPFLVVGFFLVQLFHADIFNIPFFLIPL